MNNILSIKDHCIGICILDFFFPTPILPASRSKLIRKPTQLPSPSSALRMLNVANDIPDLFGIDVHGIRIEQLEFYYVPICELFLVDYWLNETVTPNHHMPDNIMECVMQTNVFRPLLNPTEIASIISYDTISWSHSMLSSDIDTTIDNLNLLVDLTIGLHLIIVFGPPLSITRSRNADYASPSLLQYLL